MAGLLTGHGVVLGLDLAVDVAGVLGTSPLAVEVGLDGHVCGRCVEGAVEVLLEWGDGAGERGFGEGRGEHFQAGWRGSVHWWGLAARTPHQQETNVRLGQTTPQQRASSLNSEAGRRLGRAQGGCGTRCCMWLTGWLAGWLADVQEANAMRFEMANTRRLYVHARLHPRLAAGGQGGKVDAQ